MISRLEHEIANMGCFSSEYDRNTLNWMEEATRRIESLSTTVDGLLMRVEQLSAELAGATS